MLRQVTGRGSRRVACGAGNVVAIAAVVLGSWLVTAAPAGATGHEQSSSHDPTPASPGSGDEVTVNFHGEDTAQGRADVAAAKAAFDGAMAGSDDMRAKVADAGQKHGGVIHVNIGRDIVRDPDDGNPATGAEDNQDVGGGQAETEGDLRGGHAGQGDIWVDPKDCDEIVEALTGKPADKTLFAGNAFLVTVLAHEIDHLRHEGSGDLDGDGTQEGHKDPSTDSDDDGDGKIDSSNTAGPAVDDENNVHDDLGDGVHRNTYDSSWDMTATVLAQKLLLDWWKFFSLLHSVSNDPVVSPLTPTVVDPVIIQGVPGTGWILPSVADGDLDGVPTATDNAPTWSNPQQADPDFDGQGYPTDFDMDNDGDGIPDAFEMAGGSSPLDRFATKEHWAVAGSCADGLDNDRDRRIDLADKSCLRSLFVNVVSLPTPIEPELVFPDGFRRDLGGLPENLDLLPVYLRLSIDTNSNGTPDVVDICTGHVVVQRKPRGDSDLDGLVDVPIEIVALNLTSCDPITVQVRENPASSVWSVLEQQGPLSSTGYPATLGFDVRFNLRNADGTIFRQPVGSFQFSGTTTGWVPQGTKLDLQAPVPLLDAVSNPTGEVVLPSASFLAFDLLPPVPSMQAPTAAYELDRTIQVRTTATDAMSGTASYDLRERRAPFNGGFRGGVFVSNFQVQPLLTFTRPPGNTYCYASRWRDNAGNLSGLSAERCTAIPLDDRAFSEAKGPWKEAACTGCFLGTVRTSSMRGAKLVRKGIQAGKIVAVVTKCPGCGTFVARWNGIAIKKVNLNAATTRKKQLVVLKDFIGVKAGDLTFEVVSSGMPVKIDGGGPSRAA